MFGDTCLQAAASYVSTRARDGCLAPRNLVESVIAIGNPHAPPIYFMTPFDSAGSNPAGWVSILGCSCIIIPAAGAAGLGVAQSWPCLPGNITTYAGTSMWGCRTRWPSVQVMISPTTPSSPDPPIRLDVDQLLLHM